MMERQIDDRAVIRSFEGIRNKRTMAFVIAGFIAFAVLIGMVVGGFWGRRIWQGATAMSAPNAHDQPTMSAAPPSDSPK